MRQEKGGECDNGHKDESQALYRIWEGFKTICVLDILGVCVCVFMSALLGFLYNTEMLVSMYFQFPSDWFS